MENKAVKSSKAVMLDAGAHRRLVLQDTIPIPRRNIEVILPDGQSSYRTTNSRAHSLVKQGDGYWVNEQQTGVQLYFTPELIKPRELTKANWNPTPSPFPDGAIVLQMLT